MTTIPLYSSSCKIPIHIKGLIVKDTTTQETILLQSLSHPDAALTIAETGLNAVIWQNKDYKQRDWVKYKSISLPSVDEKPCAWKPS